MTKIQRRFFCVAIGLLASANLAIAKPSGKVVAPAYTSSAAAAVQQLYSTYLKQNPSLQLQAAAIGKIDIVQFGMNGGCPSNGCYTTAVTVLPNGNYRQVFALQARSVAYYDGNGPYPVLRVNGIDWYYTVANGYIADLKSAGNAFVPTLRPEGRTADEIGKALATSGWPNGVKPLIHEIQPGGGAPTTLLAIPDMTTKPGQLDCAAAACHVWFLVYANGAWTASAGTTGTGLLAVLPPGPSGGSRIGVAESGGFFTFSWSVQDARWEQIGSTFSPVPGQRNK